MTGSMQRAIDETNRRREIQRKYNEENGITPHTVIKGIRDLIDIGISSENEEKNAKHSSSPKSAKKMTRKEKDALIEKLTKEMKDAAKRLEFEQAAFLRDRIKKLR